MMHMAEHNCMTYLQRTLSKTSEKEKVGALSEAKVEIQ